MAFLFPSALSHCSHSGQLLSHGNMPGDTYYALEGGGDEATVHGNEGAAHVGLWGREEGQGGGGEHNPGVRSAPHAAPPGPTWMSSSLELKWDMMTFSPSETRVREMPRRPLARSWLSAGRIFSRQPRIVFTRLKEGCSGPRNRFRASLDTSMMLAPASPVSAGPRVRGQHAWLSAPPWFHARSPKAHRLTAFPATLENSQCPAQGLAHHWDFCYLPLERQRQATTPGGLTAAAKACPLPGISQLLGPIHESLCLAWPGPQPGKGGWQRFNPDQP